MGREIVKSLRWRFIDIRGYAVQKVGLSSRQAGEFLPQAGFESVSPDGSVYDDLFVRSSRCARMHGVGLRVFTVSVRPEGRRMV